MRERLDAFHRAAFLCSVLALAIAAPAIAEDSEDSEKRGAPRTRKFEQFDTDGDGRLPNEERNAARDKRHKRRGRGPGERPAVDQPGNAPQEP